MKNSAQTNENWNSLEIVVVDNEVRWVEFMVSLLEAKFKHVVHPFLQAEAAFGELKQGDLKPSIIFSDLAMSGLDGYNFIVKYIQDEELTYNAPVVAMTRSTAQGALNNAKSCGAYDCIDKLELLTGSALPLDRVFKRYYAESSGRFFE